MTSIFERRGNPARNLFRLWDTLIDTNGGHSAAYGPHGHTIHRVHGNHSKNVIGYAGLYVCRDGRFKINALHGHKRRCWVSKGTFLGFRHWRGGYNWFVDFNEPAYWQSQWSIETWGQPMPYVSDRLIAPAGWRNPGWWMELEPHVSHHGEAPWKIVPSTNQRDMNDPWGTRKRLSAQQRAQWEKFVALRAKRYDLMWREELGHAAPTKVSVRPPSVVDNGTKFEGDAAVHKIVALLDVHQPAKLTPRLEEAHS